MKSTAKKLYMYWIFKVAEAFFDERVDIGGEREFNIFTRRLKHEESSQCFATEKQPCTNVNESLELTSN